MRPSINYLYFGLFFFITSLIHGFHIGLIEEALWVTKGYYLANCLFQIGFETLLLVFFSFLIQKYLRPIIHGLFIAFTFTIFLLHFVEFLLIRLMDITIINGVSLVFKESWANFVEMLYATHINLFTWVSAAVVFGGLVWFGVYLYQALEKKCSKKPLVFSISSLMKTFCILPILLIALDLALKPSFSRELLQTLPFKQTLLSNKHPIIHLKHPLKALCVQVEEQKIVKKPDVFLFVVESLRSDFITKEIAPNFTAFREENISPELSFASANGTQLSWFSIFHSQFPMRYSNAKTGSGPLQKLKDLGYKIEVFSSARLNYYQMDQKIFGENLELADAFFLNPHDDKIQAYESDRKTIDDLIGRVKLNKQGGHCYIVFLESTHFDYSFPKEQTIFSPQVEKINHLKLAFSKKGVEEVKNRYKNAIHYIDFLFGEFKDMVEKKGAWNEALIAITGDHGEEFYEEGHLFHASSLNKEQISVPIYFKLNKKCSSQIASHVDIFPTILHTITGKSPKYDGESILEKDKWPFAIVGRFNGGLAPKELLFHDGNKQLLVKLKSDQELQILNGENPEFFLPVLHRLFSK